jgi:hypothetical protein
MIEPATWKAIGDFAKSAWNSIGPLAGVLLGAYLARSWDRKKWMNDNRKNECRELLTAITKVVDAALNAVTDEKTFGGGTPEALQAAWDEDRKCMIIFHDRIFIADDLIEKNIFTLWHNILSDYVQGRDPKGFGVRLNNLKDMIRDIAMKG